MKPFYVRVWLEEESGRYKYEVIDGSGEFEPSVALRRKSDIYFTSAYDEMDAVCRVINEDAERMD